jgi:hypothetical protein
VSVALIIQHEKRMRRIILSSVAFPALQHFSTLSHKRSDFGEKLLNIKCVFFLSLLGLSETLLILGRIRREIVINLNKSSCKASVTFFRF